MKARFARMLGMPFASLILLGAGVVSGPGCAPKASVVVLEGEPCGSDQVASCRCPDGSKSVAFCELDGTVGVCACGSFSSSTTSTSSSGSTASGSSSSGGTGGSGGGAMGECLTAQLPYDVVDADYSTSLDRIILATSAPSELVILTPGTLDAQQVSLPLIPSSLSVAPDGLSAAVAHNGFISIVDLANGVLSKTIPTTTVAGDIVLAGNGFAYLLPESDQWVGIHSIDIAAGIDFGDDNSWGIYAGTIAKLHPSGLAIYGITVGLSPTDIEIYDISGGVVGQIKDSPYHGDYAMCGDLWLGKDGARIFTGCGTAFKASPGTAEDMKYSGAFEESSAGQLTYRSIVHDPTKGKVYAIGHEGPLWDDSPNPSETLVRAYSYDFLASEGSLPIPCMESGPTKAIAYGRFVFVSSDGAQIHVLTQAEQSGLVDEWGLVTLAAP